MSSLLYNLINGRTFGFEASSPPWQTRIITSAHRRTTSLRRRVFSMTVLLVRSERPWGGPNDVFRISSSGKAGDRNGVDDPDKDSFCPRRPLCNLAFGAGSPLRKCSSSASVPLSLAGVESLVKELNLDVVAPSNSRADADAGAP